MQQDTPTKKQYDKSFKPPVSRAAKSYNIAVSHTLNDDILRIAQSNERRNKTVTDTIRLLWRLGIQQYDLNRLAGITTTAKAKEQQAIRQAQAEAIAAEREAAKQRKRGGQAVAPAVSVMLIDDIPPAGGQQVPDYSQPHHQDQPSAGLGPGQEQAAKVGGNVSGYAANNTASPAPGVPPLLSVTPAGTVVWQGVEYSRREIEDVLLALHNVNPLFCAGMRGALNQARERRNILE